MRRLAPVLAAVTGLALGAGSGAAQCSGTGTLHPIAPASLGPVVFPTPTETELENGYLTYTGTLTVTITPTNSGRYSLCARAGTQDMGLSNDGTYRKPITDIRVKSTAATSYVSLLQTDQQVVGNLKKTQTLTLDVQLHVSWADAPGNYASSIVLSAY